MVKILAIVSNKGRGVSSRPPIQNSCLASHKNLFLNNWMKILQMHHWAVWLCMLLKISLSKYSKSMCFYTENKGAIVYWQRREGLESRHIAFHIAVLISAVCDVWQAWFISIYKVCEPMLPWVSYTIFTVFLFLSWHIIYPNFADDLPSSLSQC